jgi:hypothetical protein
MAHEYLSYLVEPTSSRWNLNLGEALTVSLPLELSGRTGEVLTPHGDSTKVTTRVEQGRCVCRYTRTFWVGKYTLLFPSETAKTREFPFQVFRDPEESNLASLTEDQTKALGSTGKLQFVSNPLANAKGDDSLVRAEPIWTWLLLALLLVMLSELVLSWRLGRRSLRKTPVLQMH